MRKRTLIGVLICALLAGCSGAPEQKAEIPAYTIRQKQTGDYFGTLSALSLYGDFENSTVSAAFERTWQQVKELLGEIEAAVAVSDPTSDIGRFNAAQYGEQMSISTHTARILETAIQAYEDTGGLYDPTVYPLVDLWGFTPRFNSNFYVPTLPYDRPQPEDGFSLPEEKYIEAFRQLVCLKGVEFSGTEEDGWTITKNIPPVQVDGTIYQAQLDLGGIAKGYAVDQVTALLRENGWEYGYFSCGTSSIGILKNASAEAQEKGDDHFTLGIRKPRETGGKGSSYAMVRLKSTFLSSSGDYEHSYLRDGMIYCHIIDPRTGWPVNTPAQAGTQNGLATVTVLGNTAAYSDALTTALCVMGPKDAAVYMDKELQGCGVLMVSYYAGETQYEVLTNLQEEDYDIQDSAYVVTSIPPGTD